MSTPLDELPTPDVAISDVAAVVQAVIAVAVAFGAPLSNMQQTSLLGLSAVIAVVLTAADTARRRGRLRFLADHAIATSTSMPADPHELALAVADELTGAVRGQTPKLTTASSFAERVAESAAQADAAAAENGPQVEPGTPVEPAVDTATPQP